MHDRGDGVGRIDVEVVGDGVFDGVFEGVGVCVLVGEMSTAGGNATPRNTCRVGAVASTVSSCCALFQSNSVVAVTAYTWYARTVRGPVAVSVRPVIEYTGSVADSDTPLAVFHLPATEMNFCRPPRLTPGTPSTAAHTPSAFSNTNVHGWKPDGNARSGAKVLRWYR